MRPRIATGFGRLTFLFDLSFKPILQTKIQSFYKNKFKTVRYKFMTTTLYNFYSNLYFCVHFYDFYDFVSSFSHDCQFHV